MKRKRLIIVAAALLGVAAPAGAAGFWFWPQIAGLVPFLKHSEDAPAPHAEEQPVHAEAKPHGEQPTEKTPLKTELSPARDFQLPQSRQSPIIAAMKTITSAQSALARGDKTASPGLKEAMRLMQSAIAQTPASPLMPQEVDVLALYILSGGDPGIADELVARAELQEQQTRMLKALIQFANADFAAAKPVLEKLNDNDFAPLLAAQLNMALAQLAESDDVKTRVTRLSRAANFAPGSLIEEAAIRRITALAAKQKDHAKFLYWADRYLRRYPQSLYGAEFDRGFVEAIAAFGGSLSHFSAEDYARILDNADTSRNVAFATAILRVAIGKADVESCERVAHALPEGATHSQELQALISSCQLGRMEGKNNADLKLAAQDGLSPETAKLLRDAVSLTEAVAAESDDGEEGFIGPVQPPAFDADHAGLAASVTQQLNATMAILNRADGHAPDPTP